MSTRVMRKANVTGLSRLLMVQEKQGGRRGVTWRNIRKTGKDTDMTGTEGTFSFMFFYEEWKMPRHRAERGGEERGLSEKS